MREAAECNIVLKITKQTKNYQYEIKDCIIYFECSYLIMNNCKNSKKKIRIIAIL